MTTETVPAAGRDRPLYRVPAAGRVVATEAAIEAWEQEHGKTVPADVVIHPGRRAEVERRLRGVPFAVAEPWGGASGNVHPVLLVGTADDGVLYVPLAWLARFEEVPATDDAAGTPPRAPVVDDAAPAQALVVASTRRARKVPS